LPPLGTVPANETMPPAGATTGAPTVAAMSMPRCWPAEYGCARSKWKGRKTWPSTGHVQARAADAGSATAHRSRTPIRRTDASFVANLVNEQTVTAAGFVVNTGYKVRR
jgi:hypothetical protein